MLIEFDTAKREATLKARGLDWRMPAWCSPARTSRLTTTRKNYGEPRKITVGFLSGRMVVLIWTPRGEGRRISLRKANEREQRFYGPRF